MKPEDVSFQRPLPESQLDAIRLQKRILTLESERKKRLHNQQELAAAKDRLDHEVARYSVIQRLVQKTLLAADEKQFVEFTLEGVVEAFELEVAYFLLKLSEPGRFLVAGAFGASREPQELHLDEALLDVDRARVIGEGGALSSSLKSLGLVSGLLCPLSEKSGGVGGVLVAGITRGGSEIFRPVTSEHCSSFAVIARQTSTIWITRQLNEEVFEHNRRLERRTESYSRFVPFEFLRLLARSNIEEINSGDSIAIEMSVLCADVVGFTTIAEQLAPDSVFNWLNEFLGHIETVIARHGGFINQYAGDAVMALFPRQTDQAVDCAIEMQRAVWHFNQHRVRHNSTPVQFGLGVHDGPLMLGALGGGQRLDSNIIGDAANVAARIESLTRHYSVPALTTGDLVARLADPDRFQFRVIDYVAVKGRSRAITLVEILDCYPEEKAASIRAAADEFQQALGHYRGGDFESAAELFGECHARVPSDNVAALMLKRCRMLASSADVAGWKGVWHWAVK